jgi:hypothetical protein
VQQLQAIALTLQPQHQSRSNDPVALEQRKMEVCLIGLQPIAMSAPGNASSEECNHHSPRQTNSQAHPRHSL